ncbi:MAG TPA: hypothetical protein VJY57_01475 [Thiopseudomonas sp.]|nr:hypothetical protein [Thiopseudomonas sp.]
MDSLKVFKTMSRYFTAQINAISHSMQLAEQPSGAAMGLENRLLVDAWNTLADRESIDTRCAAC